jgi:transposase-like protein
MKCRKCGNESFYELKNSHIKCKKCGKKYSPKKIKRQNDIIECFTQNLTALECSKKTSLNYITVKKYYEKFRIKLSSYLEENFQGKSVLEYDEYIYLEKSKNKNKRYIFDAVDFLTFHYEDKVYNLLLPNLDKYKNELISDGANEAYYKEFSNFMMFNKISKLQKKDNLIVKFWNFFEKEILKYKGVKKENFFYYLKEMEFKFNYDKQTQKEILSSLL